MRRLSSHHPRSRRASSRGSSAAESLVAALMLVAVVIGVVRYATRVGDKVVCQASSVASLGAGAKDCEPGVAPERRTGKASGAVVAADGSASADGAPARSGSVAASAGDAGRARPLGALVLRRLEPLRWAGECVGPICKQAFECKAQPPAPGGQAPNGAQPPNGGQAPNGGPANAQPPRDPVADKLAEIDKLEGELASLRERRRAEGRSSIQDGLERQIGERERAIAGLQRELFGGRVDWRKAPGDASDPDLVGRLLPLDPRARRVAMARLAPADVRAFFAKASELEAKVRSDKAALHAVVTRVTSPRIEQLRAEAADLQAQARAHFQTADSYRFAWNNDERDAERAAGARKATQARELERRILELQIEGSAPDTRERYRQLQYLEDQLWRLRSEPAWAHLPPPLAVDDEAVRALPPEDAARAWTAWARQQREYDRVAAFERALAARADRAEIQAELDAAVAAARREVHATLPDRARADFDRLFVGKAVVGDDGAIAVGFYPTDELRSLQMRQAAFVGYERIEFQRPRRLRPFDAPTTSTEALAWWLTFGSTPPARLGNIVEANHAIRATHDEMILVPGGTLLRGVGTVTARQLVRGGLCEIAVNGGLAIAADKVAEKFGPAAGAATPFAVILTALVTRRVVSGPRAKAAGPTLVAETKAAANAEAEAAANASRTASAPRDVSLPSGTAARQQADDFLTKNRVEPGTPIADGYADGGRGMRIGADGKVTTGREVIVVDRVRDAALKKHLEYARSVRNLPEGERARLLAEYVDRVMTPASGRGASVDAVNAWQPGRAGKEVLLGDVPALGGGVCRHRSLLYKVLGDEAGLDVALVRGNLKYEGIAGPQLGGHAWNEVRLAGGDVVIVDVMNPTVGSGGRFSFPRSGQTGDAYCGMNGQPLYRPSPPPKRNRRRRPAAERRRARMRRREASARGAEGSARRGARRPSAAPSGRRRLVRRLGRGARALDLRGLDLRRVQPGSHEDRLATSTTDPS